MLRNKLFMGFALIVVIFSVLSILFGVQIINSRVIDEAKSRVSMDLNSVWAVFNNKLNQVETIVHLVASKELVYTTCEKQDWANAEARNRIERIRVNFGLDFINVLSPDGQVVMRTTPPYGTGDYRTSHIAVEKAKKGEIFACMTLMSGSELKQESEDLAEKAFMELEATPRSRKCDMTEEKRGMMMVCAVPVERGNHLLGIIYGGVMLNRNHKLVDAMHDVVFKNETYKGKPMGTATIFLNDSRIATTVLNHSGNRAIGSRVSKEVADRVLDNGKEWVGDAYVLDEKYITAYDPIKDGNGEVIGMLYVGLLQEKFVDAGKDIIFKFVLISLFALVVAIVLSFIIASRLAQPIHRLVEASKRVSNGDHSRPVSPDSSCHETTMLIKAFNDMTRTLAEREDKLKALNKSYMETLGFVSHELKSPLATVMNYVYLMREKKLGPLTEKQDKAVRSIDIGISRLVEMVRHYLNLSRIENNELEPVKTKVVVLEDILTPYRHAAESELAIKKMQMEMNVGSDVVLHADMNMAREIFENLLNNAQKYGKAGGRIVVSSRPVDDDMVEFTVQSEGEGIAVDKMGELFQKFSRLNGTDAVRQERGSGLGLFITKNLVEAHCGSIKVASEQGKSASFIFTLPAFTEKKQSV